jgi:hypothetical protein
MSHLGKPASFHNRAHATIIARDMAGMSVNAIKEPGVILGGHP